MKSVRQFLRHALNNPLEHGRAIMEHDIGVQLLAGVDVTLRETLDRCVVESAGFFTSGNWLENISAQWRMSALSADSDDVSVREHVGFILDCFRRQCELCDVIKGNVATFLYDSPNTLPLCALSIRKISTDNRPLFSVSQTCCVLPDDESLFSMYSPQHSITVQFVACALGCQTS